MHVQKAQSFGKHLHNQGCYNVKLIYHQMSLIDFYNFIYQGLVTHE